MLQVMEKAQIPVVQPAAARIIGRATTGMWSIRCIDDLAALQSVKDQWLELERSCDSPFAAFQCYAWCESWAKHNCNDTDSASLRVRFIYKNAQLVAILPMMITYHLGARALTLLGEPHSQIANIMVHSGVDCTRGIRQCLQQMEQEERVDVVTLGPIPTGSPLIAAMNPKNISDDPAGYMSSVTWPSHWDQNDYVDSLKKNRRKDFKKKHRRLEELGKVAFYRRYGDDEEFSTLIDQAVAWKRDWVNWNKIVSVGLSYANIVDFLAGCLARSKEFQLETEVLSLNGSPIAICINLVGKGMRNCYLSAYDPIFANLSPGTLIHQLAIQNSIKDGDRAYNFLGFPTPFKDMWSNQSHTLVRYQRPLTLRGKIWLLVWVNKLRPLAKFLVSKLHSVKLLLPLVTITRSLVVKLTGKSIAS